MSRTIATERCGSCGASVPITPSTVRSTYGLKALCGRCSSDSPEYRFASVGETRAYTKRIRCSLCAQMKPRGSASKVDGDWVCADCADEADNTSYKERAQFEEVLDRHPAVRRSLEIRASWSAEERAEYDAVVDAVVSGDDARIEEILDRYEDRDDDYDDGYEVRTDPDGELVYGPESDGRPVDGIFYESRWWNQSWVKAEERRLSAGVGDWRTYDAQMELV